MGTFNISTITKRKIALSSSSSCKDNLYLCNRVRNSINESKSTIGNDAQVFFKSCENLLNANKYSNQCLDIIEKIDPIFKDNLTTMFSDRIIPYIKNLDSVKESVLRHNIPEKLQEKILRSIKENKISDRINNNNANINRRFNLERVLIEKQFFPLEESIFSCCALIDTYQVPYYGKANIALEQVFYIMEKNNLPYNKKDIASLILEYYMLSDPDVVKNYKNFEKVATTNIFTEEFSSIDDILAGPTEEKEMIKTDGDIEDTIYKILNTTEEEIISKLDSVIYLVKKCIFVGKLDKEQIQKLYHHIAEILTEKVQSQDNYMTLKEKIEEEIGRTKSYIDRISVVSPVDIWEEYKKSLEELLNSIIDKSASLYPDKAIESTIEFKSSKNYGKAMSLQEFKLFRFNNLITNLFNLDRLLKTTGNKFIKNISDHSKKIFHMKKNFFEEGTVWYLNEEDHFDVCVASFEANTLIDAAELHSYFQEFTEALNMTIEEGARVYYTCIDSIFELHLEDSVRVVLSEKEEKACKGFGEYDIYNWSVLKSSESILNGIEKIKYDKIEESLLQLEDADRLCSIIELSQYMGLYNKEVVEALKENYEKNHTMDFVGNTKLSTIVDNWNSITSDGPLCAEAIDLFYQSFSEAVNLNSLKLSIEGLKDKAKNLGSKEKEMSRNLDMTMNHFMNSMKTALTNDRREAIIKGSIIPSFSKCLKTGIALAGVGFVAGPVVAAITAFAGLAISKNLNRKERALMLDEIDIELQAVDKELSQAENGNNMKRYRQLLTYQKKLQREKQRIKYNVQLGDSNRPDSSIGTAYKRD